MVAAWFASLPMSLIMNQSEQNILKLFFFPLACRCFVDKMLEIKVLPTFKKHGDILGYLICAGCIGVMQITEKYSNSPSMHKMVQIYNRLTPSELRYFNVQMLHNRAGINSSWH